MLFSKLLSTRLFLASKRYYSTPQPAQSLVSPHNSYVIPKRGFRPAMKYEIYDTSKHLTREELENYQQNSLIKSAIRRLPRPFDKMDYKAVCRYVEWSYPYTGLDIKGHINNMNKLVGETGYERTLKIIDVYKIRYNIEDKAVYDKVDLLKLIKPYRTTMKANLQQEKESLLLYFSSIASEKFKELTQEQINEYERIVEEDWANLKEVFQYDAIKAAWKSRDAYSMKDEEITESK
ncbi:unnamed protein product [Hanseniaspora opuntiae]